MANLFFLMGLGEVAKTMGLIGSVPTWAELQANATSPVFGGGGIGSGGGVLGVGDALGDDVYVFEAVDVVTWIGVPLGVLLVVAAIAACTCVVVRRRARKAAAFERI